MADAGVQLEQIKKIEKLYDETRQWKSGFLFMDDEISFLFNILHSYQFEPNTPKHFKRLQNYLKRLDEIKPRKFKLQRRILEHEGSLGGILECTDPVYDFGFYQKHNKVMLKVEKKLTIFKN